MQTKHYIILLLSLVLGCASCQWHEAEAVIAMADSIDQTQHVIYDDTAALGLVIRQLDNPMGRVFKHSTLGKAYYYMGRNLEDNHQQIAEAAECYIEADRLQIADPIYRGRVNSCMGYICAQNNSDSLALIFYERASEKFKEGGDEWRYAQSILSTIQSYIYLQSFSKVDSLLEIIHLHPIDITHSSRYNETMGLYHYTLQQYDSALTRFNDMITPHTKCYAYLHIIRVYMEKDCLNSTIPYALHIINNTEHPNLLKNAYYCLMQDAKIKNDIDLLSHYAHAREDANRLFKKHKSSYDIAQAMLQKYLEHPNPWRWAGLGLYILGAICVFLTIGTWSYRRNAIFAHKQVTNLSAHIQTQDEELLRSQHLLTFESKLTAIRNKYHTPHKRWRDYSILKKDLDFWLHDWISMLDATTLSEREKLFCAISLIYPYMTITEIAEYICYDGNGIRVFKNRILKKLDISSSNFSNYLSNLSIKK